MISSLLEVTGLSSPLHVDYVGTLTNVCIDWKIVSKKNVMSIVRRKCIMMYSCLFFSIPKWNTRSLEKLKAVFGFCVPIFHIRFLFTKIVVGRANRTANRSNIITNTLYTTILWTNWKLTTISTHSIKIESIAYKFEQKYIHFVCFLCRYLSCLWHMSQWTKMKRKHPYFL